MAERMTWSDDDLIDGRLRSGARDERAGATQRRFSLAAVMAGGVLAAALVGSGVTWLLVGGSDRGSSSSAPPLIKADEKPIKVHPDTPGGMTVENADKLVYSRLRGETPKGEVERILPEPEQPQRPGPADVSVGQPTSLTPSPPAGSAASLWQPPGASAPADTGDRSVGARSAPIQLGNEPADSEEEPEAPKAPPVVAAPPAPPPPAKPAPKVVESKPPQVAMARPVPAAPPAKPAEKPAAAPAPAPATGKYQLQLLAARSADDATAAWKKIQAKNGDVLGGFSGSVVKANLGDRGIFYRLRVGPIASEDKAQSICSALASRSVSCLIIRPGR